MATHIILVVFAFLLFSCGEEAAVKGNTTNTGANDPEQAHSPQNTNTSQSVAGQGENTEVNTTPGKTVQPANGYPSDAGNLDDTATELPPGIQPGKTAPGSTLGPGKINPKRSDLLDDTATEAPSIKRPVHQAAGERPTSGGQYPAKTHNLEDTASENGSRSSSNAGSTGGNRRLETTGPGTRVHSNSKQGLDDTARENRTSLPFRRKAKNATLPSRKG